MKTSIISTLLLACASTYAAAATPLQGCRIYSDENLGGRSLPSTDSAYRVGDFATEHGSILLGPDYVLVGYSEEQYSGVQATLDTSSSYGFHPSDEGSYINIGDWLGGYTIHHSIKSFICYKNGTLDSAVNSNFYKVKRFYNDRSFSYRDDGSYSASYSIELKNSDGKPRLKLVETPFLSHGGFVKTYVVELDTGTITISGDDSNRNTPFTKTFAVTDEYAHKGAVAELLKTLNHVVKGRFPVRPVLELAAAAAELEEHI